MRVNLIGLLAAQAEMMVVKFCKVTAEFLFCCLHRLQAEMEEVFRNDSF